jgi:cell division protein FtsX
MGQIVPFTQFVWPVLGIFAAIGVITGVFGSVIMISKYLRKEGSEFSAL